MIWVNVEHWPERPTQAFFPWFQSLPLLHSEEKGKVQPHEFDKYEVHGPRVLNTRSTGPVPFYRIAIDAGESPGSRLGNSSHSDTNWRGAQKRDWNSIHPLHCCDWCSSVPSMISFFCVFVGNICRSTSQVTCYPSMKPAPTRWRPGTGQKYIRWDAAPIECLMTMMVNLVWGEVDHHRSL